MFSRTGNPVGNQGNPVGARGLESPTRWLRPLPALLLLFGLFHRLPLALPPPPGDLSEDIANRLATEFGLSASPSDVEVIDPPPPVTAPYRTGRVWALANAASGSDDVFLVHIRRSPEGGLIEVERVFNVTDTSAVSERHFSASGTLAAYTVGDAEHDYSLHLLRADRGPRLEPGSSKLQTWQMRLQWLQQFGQTSGIASRHFKMDPPAKRTWLNVEGSRAVLRADGRKSVVPVEGPPLEGGRYLSERPQHLARPGNLVTWAVDRMRAFPWFGDERMQILKAVAYRALDAARTSGLDLGVGPAADEVETLTVEPPTALPRGPTKETASRREWPPPALEPVFEMPLENEGQWLSLDRDPFVRPLPDGSSPFLTTFLRTDLDREFSRILITLWDSRLMELSMQSGTEEPKTATGEHGTGLVPRDPSVLSRLAAAFNGGFQGTHGNFGMGVDGVTFVPPKPFAATVAQLQDGNAGFGTWPNDTAIPDEIRSFRQNLTPLVVDGKKNPYGRVFWGGAPEGWEDRTRTVRSGLCLTTHGHIAYLYGASVDHEALAVAMQRLDCEYGLHLDMNQGHTGLEFYYAASATELRTLSMPLDDMWQAEGEVEDAPGFRFRGRRMFKTMQLMNFPRYIRREARDFFYLTQKHLLPGLPLPSVGADEETMGRWSREGLVPEEFPYALMRTESIPDATRPDTKVHALEIDPARVAPLMPGATPVMTVQPTRRGTALVVFDGSRFRIEDEPPGPEAVVFAAGTKDDRAEAVAALGLRDDSGFLLYLEVATARDPKRDGSLLRGLLERAGCSRNVLLEQPLPIALNERRDLSGHPLIAAEGAVVWGKSETSKARRIFTETPIVERAIWRPLQQAANPRPPE